MPKDVDFNMLKKKDGSYREPSFYFQYLIIHLFIFLTISNIHKYQDYKKNYASSTLLSI